MSDSLDVAWKVRAAQVDWTGKVDTKASFAFAIESAALGLTVALSSAGRAYTQLSNNLGHALYWVGLVMLLLGAGFALAVVIPRLRSSRTGDEAVNNYIYFGHLRHWNARDLAAKVQDEDALLNMLSRQCVIMAQIAWRKHCLVQISMGVGAAGIGLLVICGALTTL